MRGELENAGAVQTTQAPLGKLFFAQKARTGTDANRKHDFEVRIADEHVAAPSIEFRNAFKEKSRTLTHTLSPQLSRVAHPELSIRRVNRALTEALAPIEQRWLMPVPEAS